VKFTTDSRLWSLTTGADALRHDEVAVFLLFTNAVRSGVAGFIEQYH
jgi:hypothetical protein